MSRMAGDFQGKCNACDEYVEFAVGIQTDRPPVAMHFGPGGPSNVQLSNLELRLMVEDSAEVDIEYLCPLCGMSSSGRLTCRVVPVA